MAASSSSETLTDATVLSAPCSPSNLSSVTLVGSSPSDNNETLDINQTPTAKEPPSSEMKEEPIEKPAPKQLEKPPHHRVSISKPEVEKKMERAISEDTEGAFNSYKNFIFVQKLFSDQSEDMTLFYTTLHRASCSSTRSMTNSSTTSAVLHVIKDYFSK